MSYLDGELELMTTSEDHERITNWIARLVEAYLMELGIEYSSYGAYTQKEEVARAGLEPAARSAQRTCSPAVQRASIMLSASVGSRAIASLELVPSSSKRRFSIV